MGHWLAVALCDELEIAGTVCGAIDRWVGRAPFRVVRHFGWVYGRDGVRSTLQENLESQPYDPKELFDKNGTVKCAYWF